MRKYDREKIYRAISAAGLCKFHVRACREAKGELTIHGSIHDPVGGCVAFMIFIDDIGPMIHWHSASANLNPRLFDSVNEYHGRKATSYCDDWPDLVAELVAVAELTNKGELFA